MIGFIYAGQGAQHVGEGKDLYEKYESFRRVFDQAAGAAERISPMDIKKLSFEGPVEELSRTEYTQPAMAAFGAGITELLSERGIRPDFALGLSLGEYSALYAAGVFDLNSLMHLLVKRGQFMTEAARGRDVKMSAVLQCERVLVEECCEKATKEIGGGKIAAPSNYNCPGQIVISGDTEAVIRAEELLKESGVRRIMALNVSGPFHTSLMKKAGDALSEEFQKVSFQEPSIRVVFNCIGREKTKEESIPELLKKQVQSPVYLEDSVRYLKEQGVTRVIEIGPGHTVGKLVKKTCPDMAVFSIDTAEDFEKAVEEIGG